MELLRPGFLLAGGLFALFPLVLHLLVPRTRERRVLPTVRFLSPSARTRIRVQRRPTDLRLLALRMAFAFLLGAAFAGVHWHGWGGGGTATLMVVDGGERLGAGWPGVREAVSERWSPGDPVVVVDGVDVEGGVRLRRGVPSDLEELVRLLEDGDGASPNTMSVLLRALRDEAAGGSALPGSPDSIQAVLVSGARAGMWTPGLTRVRPLLWPGSVEWIPPRFPHPIPVPSVEVEAAPALAALLEGALASAGWRVVPTLGGVGDVGDVGGAGGGTRDTASDQVPDLAPGLAPDTAPDAILHEEPGGGSGGGTGPSDPAGRRSRTAGGRSLADSRGERGRGRGPRRWGRRSTCPSARGGAPRVASRRSDPRSGPQSHGGRPPGWTSLQGLGTQRPWDPWARGDGTSLQVRRLSRGSGAPRSFAGRRRVALPRGGAPRAGRVGTGAQ